MIDETARRAELVTAARAALADLFDRHERVFMAFSGGKDSLTLLDRCEPWRGRGTLLWVNTGHMAPFMADFVRSHAGRYDLVELAPEQPMMDQWAEIGTPADIVPVEHVAGMDWRAPRLQAWVLCCFTHRNKPIHDYLERLGQRYAFLNGQRESDRGATVNGLATVMPGQAEVSLPIWTWSTADVLAYVEAHGIQLHPHHAEVPTSIECICCPANLSSEKLRLLDRLYPEEAASIRNRARGALGLAARKANEIIGVLDGTGLAAREVNR